MYRILIAAALALGLASLPSPTQAQASSRSYAPEDLRQLSTQDRIRVLETEYREQSNGRRLPTDQRDFYLAQINSGWTFSRIKADMAQSLRGSGGGNPGYPGGGWNSGNPGSGGGQTFRCESVKERYNECRVDSRKRVVLNRTLSKADCVEGRSWGQRDGVVWVNWGCRGEFTVTGNSWGGGNSGYSVTCSSTHDSYRTCAWNSRYGRPRLIETLSKTQCVEGRTWGYRGNNIWVDGGCRGRFGASR
jgi:hypothetical protein